MVSQAGGLGFKSRPVHLYLGLVVGLFSPEKKVSIYTHG